MIVWAVGDSSINSAAQSLSSEIGASDVILSTRESALPDQVWAELLQDSQLREAASKSWSAQLLVVVVVFINNQDYDSEGTIHRIITRLNSKATKILYFVPENSSAELLDGFTHFEGNWLQYAVIGTKNLKDMYDEASS